MHVPTERAHIRRVLNDIDLSGLPPWLQVLGVLVLAILGGLWGKSSVRKKRTKQRASLIALDPTPGRSGSGATRELAPDERDQFTPEYDPNPDGDPDPGEVVWTWVPYVENDGRGKDRPVLIIARLGADAVVGCYLSTKQHRGFLPVGAGPWDSKGRPSYLNPERLLRVSRNGLRREGAVLPRERFNEVTSRIMRLHKR